MRTQGNMGFLQILVKAAGSIFLPNTTVVIGGNQWLAWRLSSVDDFPSPLSRVAMAPQGPPEDSLAISCNEMFRTGRLSC